MRLGSNERVYINITLDNSEIVLPQDIDDPIERKFFEDLRNSAYKIIGHLQCPHNKQLCDITLTLTKERLLTVVNVCHEDFSDLVAKELQGGSPPGFSFQRRWNPPEALT